MKTYTVTANTKRGIKVIGKYATKAQAEAIQAGMIKHAGSRWNFLIIEM
tara:strand:- start:358 stop:504 length:147 start_codon:yes stop_codon:yes gene_type:complete